VYAFVSKSIYMSALHRLFVHLPIISRACWYTR